jgi:hypothetical protein
MPIVPVMCCWGAYVQSCDVLIHSPFLNVRLAIQVNRGFFGVPAGMSEHVNLLQCPCYIDQPRKDLIPDSCCCESDLTDWFPQDEEVEEDDEFYTAHNTMVERHRKKDGTIVSSVDTITDLGTLVIIDDPGEEDEMDTMKSGCG